MARADARDRADGHAVKITSETITDEQIRELRAWAETRAFTEAGSISQLCACAIGVLSPEVPGWKAKHEARARCAEILNARVERDS